MATLEPRGPTPQRADSMPASIRREDCVKQTGDCASDASHGGVSPDPVFHRPQALPSCPLPSDLLQPFQRVSLSPPDEAPDSLNQQQDDGSGISGRNNVAALATSKLVNQNGPKVCVCSFGRDPH